MARVPYGPGSRRSRDPVGLRLCGTQRRDTNSKGRLIFVRRASKFGDSNKRAEYRPNLSPIVQ